MLFKTKPNYKELRTFGCLWFPHLRHYNKHKLSLRSTSCTFLGYANNQKGFKCLGVSGRFYISRHVKFNETVFLFADKDIKSTKKIVATEKLSVSPPKLAEWNIRKPN